MGFYFLSIENFPIRYIEGILDAFQLDSGTLHISLTITELRNYTCILRYSQGSRRLEKYLNLEGFLEKSLKIKPTLSTGKSLKSLEKSLNSTIFCRT